MVHIQYLNSKYLWHFFRFVCWLLLLERFGPIVINITRVMMDIFTLVFTYIILLVAFTFGLVYILDGSSNVVNTDGTPYFDPNNGTWSNFLHNFGNLMFDLGFIVLDPGAAPPIPDGNPREKYAKAMFVIYCIFTITIILNLAITLMNATIQRFQDQRQLYWKFQKTSICIEFFDHKLSLPVPFSILRVIWTLIFLPFLKCFTFCYYRNKKTDELESKHLSRMELQTRRRHAKLMQELINRLINKNKKTKKRFVKTKSVKQHESRC